MRQPLIGLVMLGVTCWMGGDVFGDRERGEAVKNEPRVTTIALAAHAPSEYWLGVFAVPVDAALESQLNLKDRLIVQHIVPDGPAAKAGMKEHDILLKFGDAEIHNLDDLIKAVGENKDKEVVVTLLRGGKEQTVRAKPKKRPPEDVIKPTPHAADHWEDAVQDWLRGRGGIWWPDGSLRMRFFGPGFVDSEPPELPGDLSISLTKKGDQPATIIVEKNGEKWEITEDKLDDLPDDIRPHVERLLGRQRIFGFRFGPDGKELEIETRKHRWDPDAVRRGYEDLRREIFGKDALEKLNRKLEELRKEVDRLKKRDQKGSEAKKTSRI
jgi:membrane-associated protease RseP (regulator of RpoE activity)